MRALVLQGDRQAHAASLREQIAQQLTADATALVRGLQLDLAELDRVRPRFLSSKTCCRWLLLAISLATGWLGAAPHASIARAQSAASCASSGCQLGDACNTDAECRTGGDSSATCDPTGKVCVTVCATTSIVSQANLDAARYCREINGDLIVNPNFATIPASALPYLTRIRGRFNADPSGVPNMALQSLTFAALQTVDGGLSFGLFTATTVLSFRA